MKVNDEIKEEIGFVLIGLVGPIVGFFVGMRVQQLISENLSFGVKLIFSGLACAISALPVMVAGFILATKKYDKLHYDQRLKGHTK